MRGAMPRMHRAPTETPIERSSVTRGDGQGAYRGNGSGSRASPGGRSGASLPRGRGPRDRADRRTSRSLAGDGQGVLLRPVDANKRPTAPSCGTQPPALGGAAEADPSRRSESRPRALRARTSHHEETSFPRRTFSALGRLSSTAGRLGFSCPTGSRNAAVRRNSPVTTATRRVWQSPRLLAG